MNITITTDASFYVKDKVGGFAFQIRSDEGLIKLWGPLKGDIQNPTEAEMKSIINALHILVEKNYKINFLTINTDCEFIVKHMFTDKKKRKDILKELTKTISKYLNLLDYEVLNIKHVKAHTGDFSTARSRANDWCDHHSRAGSLIASEQKKNCIN